MTDDDISSTLVELVCQETKEKQRQNSESLSHQDRHSWNAKLRCHSGILDLDTIGQSVSVRTGTQLHRLNLALKQAGYMLPFEPPLFDLEAMVVSMIARGMAGPRRPWAGDLADNLMGGRLIDGLGRLRHFGIEARDELAGSQACRQLVGGVGMQALLTEVRLRITPCPHYTKTLRLELDPRLALQEKHRWTGLGSAISAFCHTGEALYLRLESSRETVCRQRDQLGGDEVSGNLWDELRELRLAFFQDPRPLWELAVAQDAPLARLPGDTLLEWNGNRRWLKSDAPGAAIRLAARALGGQARCFDTNKLQWIE